MKFLILSLVSAINPCFVNPPEQVKDARLEFLTPDRFYAKGTSGFTFRESDRGLECMNVYRKIDQQFIGAFCKFSNKPDLAQQGIFSYSELPEYARRTKESSTEFFAAT